MSENNKQSRQRRFQEGYQPSLEGLKYQDGKPVLSLNPKDLKPPKGGSAIVRPKPPASDKPSQS